MILDTYYILASNRIHRGKRRYDTIQIAASIFSPSAAVLYQDDPQSAKEQYMVQLAEDAKAYLATLVKGAIKKGYHIAILATPKEEHGGHYLRYIREYVQKTFHFPIYDYGKFIRGKSELVSYDADAVLSFCNRVIEEERKKDRVGYYLDMETWSKKKLRRKLKEHELYPDANATREEMADLLIEIEEATPHEPT